MGVLRRYLELTHKYICDVSRLCNKSATWYTIAFAGITNSGWVLFISISGGYYLHIVLAAKPLLVHAYHIFLYMLPEHRHRSLKWERMLPGLEPETLLWQPLKCQKKIIHPSSMNICKFYLSRTFNRTTKPVISFLTSTKDLISCKIMVKICYFNTFLH